LIKPEAGRPEVEGPRYQAVQQEPSGSEEEAAGRTLQNLREHSRQAAGSLERKQMVDQINALLGSARRQKSTETEYRKKLESTKQSCANRQEKASRVSWTGALSHCWGDTRTRPGYS
jgi:hypothetical protein